MDYLVELDFEGPGFVAVPNAVVDDSRVSADALAALVYMARLAGGRGARIVRVSAIRSRFGWGKDRWQRVARELRATGAMQDNFGRSDDGRNVVRSLSVGWPKAKPGRETCGPGNPAHRGETCGPGNPAHTAGNPAHVSRVTRPLKRYKTQKAAEPAAPQSAKRVSAALSEKRDTREAAGGASATAGGSRVEAAQEAENEKSNARPPVSGIARYAKQNAAAACGLAVRCPDSGEWLSAAQWQAKHVGGVLQDAVEMQKRHGMAVQND